MDCLLGLAMREAAAFERPLAVIPRSIAATRDIEKSLAWGEISLCVVVSGVTSTWATAWDGRLLGTATPRTSVVVSIVELLAATSCSWTVGVLLILFLPVLEVERRIRTDCPREWSWSLLPTLLDPGPENNMWVVCCSVWWRTGPRVVSPRLSKFVCTLEGVVTILLVGPDLFCLAGPPRRSSVLECSGPLVSSCSPVTT